MSLPLLIYWQLTSQSTWTCYACQLLGRDLMNAVLKISSNAGGVEAPFETPAAFSRQPTSSGGQRLVSEFFRRFSSHTRLCVRRMSNEVQPCLPADVFAAASLWQTAAEGGCVGNVEVKMNSLCCTVAAGHRYVTQENTAL